MRFLSVALITAILLGPIGCSGDSGGVNVLSSKKPVPKGAKGGGGGNANPPEGPAPPVVRP
jgi:hypothetical protein